MNQTHTDQRPKEGQGFGWWLVWILALGVALAVSRYLALQPEMYFPEQRAVYLAHPYRLWIHVAGGLLALLLGPWLFRLARRPAPGKLHRWLGRVYLTGVLVGGLAGMAMAPLAWGGLLAKSGFFILSLLWLATGVMAYLRIRQARVALHRRWMVRNYALTFAAVTLRLWMPMLLLGGVPMAVTYPLVAWLCWVPNLVWAEWRVANLDSGILAAVRD